MLARWSGATGTEWWQTIATGFANGLNIAPRALPIQQQQKSSRWEILTSFIDDWLHGISISQFFGMAWMRRETKRGEGVHIILCLPSPFLSPFGNMTQPIKWCEGQRCTCRTRHWLALNSYYSSIPFIKLFQIDNVFTPPIGKACTGQSIHTHYEFGQVRYVLPCASVTCTWPQWDMYITMACYVGLAHSYTCLLSYFANHWLVDCRCTRMRYPLYGLKKIKYLQSCDDEKFGYVYQILFSLAYLAWIKADTLHRRVLDDVGRITAFGIDPLA